MPGQFPTTHFRCVVMCYDLLHFVMCFSLGQISLGIYSINHNCPLSLDGPESSTEWVVGKGITIAFMPRRMAIHRNITGYDRCIPHPPTWKPSPQVPFTSLRAEGGKQTWCKSILAGNRELPSLARCLHVFRYPYQPDRWRVRREDGI